MTVDPAYVQAWVDRGERDLMTAQVLRQEGLHDACAVYCQQAVEKMLKACYLAVLQREPRRTHRIVELAAELELPPDLVEDLHDLENDYIQARYPDSFFDGAGTAYDDDVAGERLGTATRTIAWIKQAIAEVMPGDSDHGA